MFKNGGSVTSVFGVSTLKKVGFPGRLSVVSSTKGCVSTKNFVLIFSSTFIYLSLYRTYSTQSFAEMILISQIRSSPMIYLLSYVYILDPSFLRSLTQIDRLSMFTSTMVTINQFGDTKTKHQVSVAKKFKSFGGNTGFAI